VIEAYLADPQVVRDLRFRITNLGVASDAAQRDRDSATALSELIDEALH